MIQWLRLTYAWCIRKILMHISQCHQKMVKAESEHGSMEASEELEFRSRSTEVLMVSSSEALQGQKTRRCSAPSCLTLMIFKNCKHKHQIRSKYKMAGYAD